MSASPRAARVDRARALGALARRLPLLDFVERLVPGYARPSHLEPLAALLERARDGGVRACVSAPPRHGKSELISAWIAWMLARDPTARIMSASYGDALALERSRRARRLAIECGVELAHDARAMATWTTRAGGGLIAGGIGGSWTGRGADVVIVDDPLKSRADAQSAIIRDRVASDYRNALLTRLEPRGSALVISARQHEDDLVGRLLRDGYERVSLPAISLDEDGQERALWPTRFDLQALHRVRDEVGPTEWASLYQGEPRPAGSALFEGAHFYEGTPPDGLQIAIGVDLAYSSRASADWTCAAVLGRASDGRCYVLELHRHRAPIESTASLLRAVGGRYPGVVPRWSCGGQERAVADLLATHGVTLATRPATSDKATRAQPLAAAWARGDVLLPREASWIDALLRELAEFPQSRHDDQIDALTSAYEGAGVYATGPVAASRPSYAQRPRPYTSRSSPYSGGSPYLQQIGDRTIARFPGDRKYRRW